MCKLLKVQDKLLKLTFEEIYEKFKPFRYKVFSYWRYRTHDIEISNEDLMQELDIMFWKAYEKYDIEKSNGASFRTFATSLINQRMYNFKRDIKNDRRNPGEKLLYLNEVAAESETLEYGNLIGEEAFDNDLVVEIDFKRSLKKATELQKKVISLLMEGMSQIEIAKRLGYSQIHISRIKRSFYKDCGLRRVV